MKERPILFSGPMVRAILDGRKTQTRRVVKLRDKTGTYSAFGGDGWPESENQYGDWRRDPCPYGVPGDRLWLRETWQEFFEDEIPPGRHRGPQGRMGIPLRPGLKSFVVYRADGDLWDKLVGEARWRPSIHMPRWASRLTLEIVSVRVERLNDISEADAKAEGIERLKSGRGWYDPTTSKGAVHLGHYLATAREAFEVLWDSINAKRHPWSSNPWVWVVEFARIGGAA